MFSLSFLHKNKNDDSRTWRWSQYAGGGVGGGGGGMQAKSNKQGGGGELFSTSKLKKYDIFTILFRAGGKIFQKIISGADAYSGPKSKYAAGNYAMKQSIQLFFLHSIFVFQL